SATQRGAERKDKGGGTPQRQGGDHAVSRTGGDGHQYRLCEIEVAIDLQDQSKGHGEQHSVAAGRERGPKDLRQGCQIKHVNPSVLARGRFPMATLSTRVVVTPSRSCVRLRRPRADPSTNAAAGIET